MNRVEILKNAELCYKACNNWKDLKSLRVFTSDFRDFLHFSRIFQRLLVLRGFISLYNKLQQ